MTQTKIKIMDMDYYLNQDGGIGFNIAFFNRFASIGDSCYTDICGSFIEGVYVWADHNIESVDESHNAKYIGYTLRANDGTERRCYIERRIMEIMPTDWKHAKNLFNKFLKIA